MANVERDLVNKIAQTGGIEKSLTSGIREEHFQDESHQDIYSFIVKHFREYKIAPALQTTKEKFPEHLFETVTESLDYLRDQFLNLIKRRAAMAAVIDIAEALDDEERAAEIDTIFLEKSRELVQLLPGSTYTSFSEMPQRISRYEDGYDTVNGIELGIPAFDDLTSGIQAHEYVTIAGFSGTGKSTLAQYILFNAYQQGKTPMYISLEMEAQALFRKWDTMAVNFEYNKLKNHRLSDRDIAKWKEAAEIVKKKENNIIVMDDVRGCTVDRVYAELTRFQPDLLCIDYISLMDVSRSAGMQMWEKVTYLTQALKQTARTLKIPIIGVAQTNRSGYNSGTTMDNIAFSQSIVNDSDIILGLFQDEEMKEQQRMELRMLKNRDGQTSDTELRWKMKTMEFRPWKDSDAFIE